LPHVGAQGGPFAHGFGSPQEGPARTSARAIHKRIGGHKSSSAHRARNDMLWMSQGNIVLLKCIGTASE
jgi:hypothetical protein